MNTSLTEIIRYNIGDEVGKAIGEALKVNTSLTKILTIIILVMKGKGNRRGIESEYLVDLSIYCNNIGDEGKRNRRGIESEYSLTKIDLSSNNIGDEGERQSERH